MGVGNLRTMAVIALAAYQTLLGGLDPDDPDQVDLIARLDAVCIAIQSDLERSSS
jgi:hypothetical protein